MEKLYTIAEVSEKLNLSPKTLRRWEEAGRFTPSRTLGGQRRYTLDDIQILDALKHGTIPDQRDLLSLDAAASLFGVSPVTIDRWVNEGKIHPFITSGATYFPRSRLIAKMEELKAYTPPTPSYLPPTPPPPTITPPAPPVAPPPPPRPAPKLLPLVQPTLPHFSPPAIDLRTFIANFAVTLIMLTIYFFLTYKPATQTSALTSPQTGAVQGAATATDPRVDDLAQQFHDFVAAEMQQDAKVTPPTTVNVSGSSLTANTATLPKGKNQLSVPNANVNALSLVSVTFATDYSPAKKYWVIPSQGSFTLYTDFPVGQDSTFTYIIYAPPTPTPATTLATPSASLAP